MKINGRFPHSPNTPKLMRVSVQYGCDVSRQLVESLLQQQRLGRSIQLIKLLGKPEEKPNILPHNVMFDALENAASDHVTDILVLTHGALAQQFYIASAALQAGKQLVITDERLMHAYGEVLAQMAEAYHTRIGTAALLSGQGTLAQTLAQLAPFGVQEVLYYVDDARNKHIESQETTEATLQTPEEFPPMVEDISVAVQGVLSQKWTRPVQQPLPLPSPHTQRVAARMGGALRFLSRVTSHGAEVGLHFVPTHHPVLQGENTTVITMNDGSRQTLHSTADKNANTQARALLMDVLDIVQNPRRTTLNLSDMPTQTLSAHSLIFTNTATWREAKETFAHHIVSEQLVGTTLAVTVRHNTPLNITPEIGTVCALPHGVHVQQQAPSLRIAN